MSNNSDCLGRLKHTTKEDCGECGESKLQLRVRAVGGIEYEYLYCPKCEFEKKPEKSKLQGIWKKQISKGGEVVEDVKSSLQRGGNYKGDGKKGNRNSEIGNKRSSKRF